MWSFQSLFYWIINSITPKIGLTRNMNTKFQSLFYWIINSILFFIPFCRSSTNVSILILLDYQFYLDSSRIKKRGLRRFNPYSTGLSILSISNKSSSSILWNLFQSLFYWIINSIQFNDLTENFNNIGFNPYSTGLSILS